MGKVARKIFAQIDTRGLPRIGSWKLKHDWLAGSDAARADAVRLHVERHLDIHVDPDARLAAFRVKHDAADTFGMGQRDAQKMLCGTGARLGCHWFSRATAPERPWHRSPERQPLPWRRSSQPL